MQETKKAKSILVYRKDDSPLFSPEKMFSVSDLERFTPYVFFTGVGFLATIIEPHECDCPYCDHESETEERFFRTEAEMKKSLKSYYKDDEVEKVEEVFYACAVRQETDSIDIFG